MRQVFVLSTRFLVTRRLLGLVAHLTVCDGASVCVPVRLCKTSGALDIATLPWRPFLRHRSHRLSRVQALQNVARDPLVPFAMQRFRARSGHKYHSVQATPLLRPNARILRLPFEL